MVKITNNSLQIHMHETSGMERRDWLITAIAAAMRWNALANGDKTDADQQNQIVLAELLEELVHIEKA